MYSQFQTYEVRIQEHSKMLREKKARKRDFLKKATLRPNRRAIEWKNTAFFEKEGFSASVAGGLEPYARAREGFGLDKVWSRCRNRTVKCL